MADKQRIGLLYSYGPHFRKAACQLRERYPDSHLTALLPPSYPEAVVQDVVDAFCRCAPEPGRRRSLRQAWQLLRTVRAQRFQLLVVLFDSPKLQVLAALSGADACWCFGLDNQIRPLQRHITAAFLAGLGRAVRGRIRYASIWLQVHCRPVKTRLPESPSAPPSKENGK